MIINKCYFIFVFCVEIFVCTCAVTYDDMADIDNGYYSYEGLRMVGYKNVSNIFKCSGSVCMVQ